ncbi:DUF6522 family protein [Aquicoccus sp. G2-2]|uniref:DUF6522 family protein n=1 Tax=Aquicoccus sp. G2-2 TaxID=3092120 RepID=UPI002AE01637|nr:DUF6522 family protein [Aquicoccus sp. G2-2]MEA1113672.1 DUF6522 family protein [Aquicoccus sp. G2-2]
MAMSDPKIEIGPDKIQIDAEIVARTLKITPQDLRDRMRDGTITSQFERGEGSDEGRVRLTFYSATHRARIIADTAGTVLSRSVAHYGRPTIPAAPKDESVPPNNSATPHKHDALLDAALPSPVPASDAVAINFNPPAPARSTHQKKKETDQ